MATYIKIASSTVGSGGVASVTFSSIPATYTDLCLKISTRSSASGAGGSGVWDFATIKFNGSSTNYSERFVYGDGTTAASGSASALDFWTDYSAATASTFGSTEIYIPNYTSSNYKCVSVDTVAENNGTNAFEGLNAGLWSDTAAINSIVFTPGSGSWVQYSTFTLYGISNA